MPVNITVESVERELLKRMNGKSISELDMEMEPMKAMMSSEVVKEYANSVIAEGIDQLGNSTKIPKKDQLQFILMGSIMVSFAAGLFVARNIANADEATKETAK